jgi:hypothetical protein
LKAAQALLRCGKQQRADRRFHSRVVNRSIRHGLNSTSLSTGKTLQHAPRKSHLFQHCCQNSAVAFCPWSQERNAKQTRNSGRVWSRVVRTFKLQSLQGPMGIGSTTTFILKHYRLRPLHTILAVSYPISSRSLSGTPSRKGGR